MKPLARLVEQPTWILARANARAHGVMTSAFAEAGVRGYHYRLLAALDEYGPASQADLGRHAWIDRSDVVATLNDLVAWGYAERTPDRADRRRNVVALTDAGRSRLGELDRVLAQVQRTVLAPLAPDERDTLMRLLAKLG